ncbi:MAG: hypothetical protein HY876_04760 [Coriobacteriales bacterium]|nr:hypothetical protein [Coriobacteriales bacterium]
MPDGAQKPKRTGILVLFDRVRAGVQLSPARRRLLAFISAAVGAVLVILVIPGYLGSRPGFFLRFDSTRSAYESWSESVHAKVGCEGCHVPPDSAARALYSVRMAGEFYLSFAAPSRQPAVLNEPRSGACSRCHVDLRSVSPSGDLNIPHRAHVEVLKIPCVRCHAHLVHEKSPEGKHTPRMATCLECHDGKQAKDACSTCHTEKSAPKTHTARDWVIVHSQKAMTTDCAKCHGWTEDWCAECHSRRPRSHAGRWRTTHREKVESRRNCEACHAAGFCVKCHGEVPRLNFDPALKLVK